MGRFGYFDVLELSVVWNFAFLNFSNEEHLLHHTRPEREHSYTPLDAFKPKTRP